MTEEQKEKKRQYSRQYYIGHKNEMIDKAKEYYIQNADKIKEDKRIYHIKNKEKDSIRNKQWRERNKDVISLKKRKNLDKAITDPIKFLKYKYSSYKQYKMNIQFTKDEFIDYVINNTNFLLIHRLWLENRIKDNQPCIFITNNNKDVVDLHDLICTQYKTYRKLSNICFKGTKQVPICIIDQNNNKIYVKTIVEASKITSINRSTISRYINTHKYCKGYRFESIKENENE